MQAAAGLPQIPAAGTSGNFTPADLPSQPIQQTPTANRAPTVAAPINMPNAGVSTPIGSQTTQNVSQENSVVQQLPNNSLPHQQTYNVLEEDPYWPNDWSGSLPMAEVPSNEAPINYCLTPVDLSISKQDTVTQIIIAPPAETIRDKEEIVIISDSDANKMNEDQHKPEILANSTRVAKAKISHAPGDQSNKMEPNHANLAHAYSTTTMGEPPQMRTHSQETISLEEHEQMDTSESSTGTKSVGKTSTDSPDSIVLPAIGDQNARTATTAPNTSTQSPNAKEISEKESPENLAASEFLVQQYLLKASINRLKNFQRLRRTKFPFPITELLKSLDPEKELNEASIDRGLSILSSNFPPDENMNTREFGIFSHMLQNCYRQQTEKVNSSQSVPQTTSSSGTETSCNSDTQKDWLSQTIEKILVGEIPRNEKLKLNEQELRKRLPDTSDATPLQFQMDELVSSNQNVQRTEGEQQSSGAVSLGKRPQLSATTETIQSGQQIPQAPPTDAIVSTNRVVQRTEGVQQQSFEGVSPSKRPRLSTATQIYQSNQQISQTPPADTFVSTKPPSQAATNTAIPKQVIEPEGYITMAQTNVTASNPHQLSQHSLIKDILGERVGRPRRILDTGHLHSIQDQSHSSSDTKSINQDNKSLLNAEEVSTSQQRNCAMDEVQHTSKQQNWIKSGTDCKSENDDVTCTKVENPRQSVATQSSDSEEIVCEISPPQNIKDSEIQEIIEIPHPNMETSIQVLQEDQRNRPRRNQKVILQQQQQQQQQNQQQYQQQQQQQQRKQHHHQQQQQQHQQQQQQRQQKEQHQHQQQHQQQQQQHQQQQPIQYFEEHSQGQADRQRDSTISEQPIHPRPLLQQALKEQDANLRALQSQRTRDIHKPKSPPLVEISPQRTQYAQRLRSAQASNDQKVKQTYAQFWNNASEIIKNILSESDSSDNTDDILISALGKKALNDNIESDKTSKPAEQHQVENHKPDDGTEISDQNHASKALIEIVKRRESILIEHRKSHPGIYLDYMKL